MYHMSGELRPVGEGFDDGVEVATSHEVEPYAPRFVVYGQLGTGRQGTRELIGMFDAYLENQGMSPKRVVSAVRVDNISHAFYHGERRDRSGGVPPVLEVAIGGDRTAEVFPGSFWTGTGVAMPKQSEEGERTLPLGVIVFPDMRDYSMGSGQTIDTPVDEIRRLCEEHRVPMVVVPSSTFIDELPDVFNRFLTITEFPHTLPPSS
jgi:hypothetical protein